MVSADPVYGLSAGKIQDRIDETYDEIMEQTIKNKDEFIWEHISSVEELGRVRMAAMKEFLSDFKQGAEDGRYIAAGLPALPFRDNEFDLSLCSHFLFLYSEQLSEGFHLRAIRELCRVAPEARIFPLFELGARRSRHLEVVMGRLDNEGFEVNVEKVPYEFVKVADEMLRLRTKDQ